RSGVSPRCTTYRVNPMEERLVALEMRAAFQDDTVQQLNDALVAQQVRMDQLELRLQALTRQLEAALAGALDPAEPVAEPPPPHY
ncbi:MAG: SlyX family protein, partial [Gammaproteobacteria bacterium]